MKSDIKGIHIGEDYWILPDDYSRMVAKKTHVKTGKNKGQITWVNKTYHSTFEQLKDRVACLAIDIKMDKGTEAMMTFLENFVFQQVDIENIKNLK